MTYTVSTNTMIVLIIWGIWEIFWKSAALWRSSRNNQPWWFVIILLVNSAGIIPIAYMMTHPYRKQQDT